MEYKLIGKVIQSLHIELEPEEYIYAQEGTLAYMDSGIRRNIELNGKGFWSVIKAKLSKESIVIVKYTNSSNIRQQICFMGNSGSIFPMKITDGHKIILRRGDYIASEKKVEIELYLSLGMMAKGNEPAFQRITGNTEIFISTQDELIVRELKPGEEILVDESLIKGLYDIEESQIRFPKRFSLFKNLIAGEGMMLTSIVGPGKVYLSSSNAMRKHI